MMIKKPKKEPAKPKKKVFNPDVVPMQSKTYATLHRTLRGVRR